MTRFRFGLLACLAVVAAPLAACDHASQVGVEPGNQSPPTATPTAAVPFECPAGMPAYKCEQLKEQHDPNYNGAPRPDPG